MVIISGLVVSFRYVVGKVAAAIDTLNLKFTFYMVTGTIGAFGG